ncbi:MAG: hypothetical protein IJX19_04875 [Clostridia bacterium]|nr:hypothetical protein [Clostridia bacterium]
MKKLAALLLSATTLMTLCACNVAPEFEEEKNTAITDDTPPVSNEKSEEETTTDITNDTPPVSNDVDLQIYEAAIRGEICVYDERLGEVKLKDLRFASNDTRLDECKLLMKAILDLDQDGVEEYVIKSPNQEYIILRYYNGKVYSYCLNAFDFYHFNTNGTFHWYDSYEDRGWACGLNKIVFEGEMLTETSVYTIQYSKNPTKYEYFVEGKAATENEYYRAEDIRYERMKFSQFELTCSYPITAEQAWNLANAYWDHQDGRKERSAGTIWTARIALIDTPNSQTDCYRFAFQVAWNSGGGLEGYECMPPHTIREHDQILVNAFTGEITASTYKPDGKVLSIEEAIEIAQNHEGKSYYAEHDVKETAPDHIYVIVFYNDADHSDFHTRVWVDKYSGEIVFGYYMQGK